MESPPSPPNSFSSSGACQPLPSCHRQTHPGLFSTAPGFPLQKANLAVNHMLQAQTLSVEVFGESVRLFHNDSSGAGQGQTWDTLQYVCGSCTLSHVLHNFWTSRKSHGWKIVYHHLVLKPTSTGTEAQSHSGTAEIHPLSRFVHNFRKLCHQQKHCCGIWDASTLQLPSCICGYPVPKLSRDTERFLKYV